VDRQWLGGGPTWLRVVDWTGPEQCEEDEEGAD
jgi:hypothetical protein